MSALFQPPSTLEPDEPDLLTHLSDLTHSERAPIDSDVHKELEKEAEFVLKLLDPKAGLPDLQFELSDWHRHFNRRSASTIWVDVYQDSANSFVARYVAMLTWLTISGLVGVLCFYRV